MILVRMKSDYEKGQGTVMARYGSANEMHERILKSALEVFSAKGFSAATIRDISSRAGCNTVTVFRHFEDKLGLFLQVVERYKKFEFDSEELNRKLSYLNLHNDFRVMSDYFFAQVYHNIHILRIFINDGHGFEPISQHLWFIPEEMKNFVDGYLESMYPGKIPAPDRALLTEMFLCYILRTCLRINIQEKTEDSFRQIAREAREVMAPSVDMIVRLIMMQIKSARKPKQESLSADPA